MFSFKWSSGVFCGCLEKKVLGLLHTHTWRQTDKKTYMHTPTRLYTVAISVSFGSRRPAGSNVSVRWYSTMPLTGQASCVYTGHNDINMAKASTEPVHTHTHAHTHTPTPTHTHTQGSPGSVSALREMSMSSMPEMNAVGQKYTNRKRNKHTHTHTTQGRLSLSQISAGNK